jgi:hypothetical protein
MGSMYANIQLAKTALLGKWYIAKVDKDCFITKKIKELPIESLQEVFIDFAEWKNKEFNGEGFELSLKDKGIKIIVEPIKKD